MPEFDDWFPSSRYGTSHVNAMAFGAIGDGLPNLLTTLGFTSTSNAQNGIGGNGIAYPKCTNYLTDSADWCGIQAAVDYALVNRIMNVVLPDGVFILSDTIHLGYGMNGGVAGFNSIFLNGTGYTIIDGGPGTVIGTLFDDRPVINIQGARQSGVRRIAVYGKEPMTFNNFYDLNECADASNYINAGAKADQHAPFCGICIDGYTGYPGTATVAPEFPYPIPRYPAWVGPQPTTADEAYVCAPSSSVTVENCIIGLCQIGIMSQPWGGGNGDFYRFANCTLHYLQYGIVIPSAQARCNDFQNLNFTFLHTAIAASGYGQGIGKLLGNWSNIHVSVVYRVLHAPGGFGSPIFISSLYCEVVGVLGDSTSHVTFEGCNFDVQDMGAGPMFKSISGITWAGGVATVTMTESLATWGPMGWTSGKNWIHIVNSTNAAYNTGWYYGAEWTGPSTFTYPIASNPGSYTGGASCEVVPITGWRNEPVFYGSATFRNCAFLYRLLYHFAGGHVNFENCYFGGPTIEHYTQPPEGMAKAMDAFGHVIVDYDVNTKNGPSPWSGAGNVITGRDASLGYSTAISFDGYNNSHGHSLWGYGQKEQEYSVLYDVPPMSRFYQVAGSVTPGTGYPNTSVTWTMTGATAGDKVEVGDVYRAYGCAHYYVDSIAAGPTFTLKALTWFIIQGYNATDIRMMTDADIDYAKGSAGAGDDYHPENWNTPHYYPIGVLDLAPKAFNVAPVFMKTTVGSPTIEFVDATGTLVARPAELTSTSKPLWMGTDPVFYANTLPFPAHTNISALNPTANTVTMSASALMSGTWLYGPGIKRLK